MPRISPKLIRQAAQHSPLLPPLLRANRSLDSAKQELQWIQQLPKSQWRLAVTQRARLIPLQYILGTQPFGALDIVCRPGALIPRWETEEWVGRLVESLREYQGQRLDVMDVCTGTGCILLLMDYGLRELVEATFMGTDVSEEALAVARENLRAYGGGNGGDGRITFSHGDVFVPINHKYHLIVSNPPYIPRDHFVTPQGAQKSVRLYEPEIALVGDTEFYTSLVYNVIIPLECQGFVLELGYSHQAEAVARAVVQATTEFKVAKYYDSSDNLRCVVGYRARGTLLCLRQLCHEYIE